MLPVDPLLFGVAMIVIFTLVLYKKISAHQKEGEEKARFGLLANSLANGGPGSSGKVVGRVEVQVRGVADGAAAVCLARELNVMYWWRAVGTNGHALIGGIGSVEETLVRSAIAAIRLWGKSWEAADRVDIFVPGLENENLKTLLDQQREDCQNKYGVRVVLSQSIGGGGGRELVEQLVQGRGVGQEQEGFNNTNLRVAESGVYQLVDHTAHLSKHFFDL